LAKAVVVSGCAEATFFEAGSLALVAFPPGLGLLGFLVTFYHSADTFRLQ
jgi:hypothetical protein